MKPESKKYSSMVGGKPITFETGTLAGQAGGAVTLRLGDTMIFAAATMSPEVRLGIDYFPLTVDYEERMYAGGRIPGSFFRREGRPSEEAILIARLTDRPLRPLFPKDLRNDVQVILYSFSVDGENPIDILSINAASAALMISNVPWGGPVGAVRIGRVDGQFIVNPTDSEQDRSDLDLRIAGTRDAILMVECGAQEIPETVMVEALNFGHQSIQPLIDVQEQMVRDVGKPKQVYPSFILAEAIQTHVSERAHARLEEALDAPHTKAELNTAINTLQAEIVAELTAQDEALVPSVVEAFDESLKTVVRKRILERQLRPDGRSLTEIRPIWGEVGISPRAHGSGLFTRGETQVLTLATLGTPRDAQEIDSLTGTENKRYMHHYNFPPFSTGEVRPLRGSSRREVGHGALAERALVPVLPPETEFPYTLRLVSEVLSSNGSTSMASVCGSTLALMDTGVPIKSPVAGVAMGLIKEGDQYSILTDIQGMEDHLGDMDFKVAGTRDGITALQMDIKIKGITSEIMSKALEQARLARLFILDKILEVIPAPRTELKSFAPRITVLHIPSDKIGAVIGPGGKIIRSIQEETGVKIDIEEDGTVYIAATDGPAAEKAREMVESITEVPEAGRIYTGKVVRITDFGAFVEILPNQDGLVHISQLDSERVNKVEDIVSVGDEITVMITNIDEGGKIRLSRQAVLEGWSLEEAKEHDRPSGGRSSGGSRGGGDKRRFSRDGGNRDRRDRR
ncbi:MAG: polyribonucleotide nucleotidyltransferase [Anaerolineales bacterium]|nr:polyribonucleotide nucleotidyltransferase [Anaerolineae bacterium]PWB55090.1 MAG: polyribonucleotide nucleotidyltransferase [Anaerolineales bacterium]